MKIAIVGMGYWGPNLIRNFLNTEGVTEVSCFDLDPERVVKTKKRFTNIKVHNSLEDILKSDVDAMVLATPVSTHYPLAKAALEHGKHVLVEKPLATKASDCEDLICAASKNDRVLMVDHTFIFTGAVRKIKEMVNDGMIGNLFYFDSIRINLGLFQHDVNVIWDLAPHDLSIMNHLIDRKPTSVSATGVNHINGKEDVAYLTVQFDTGLMAHFHVNWLAPVKIRRILIGGSKKMIVYDDMQPSEKVRVYDKGVQMTTREGIYNTLVQYRTGDMFAPRIEESEALSEVAKEFVGSINEHRQPLSNGESGLNIVRLLEAAQQSIKSNGQVIKLN
ncbi:MAG: Gfo/Idh/MocA family protein [Bacteroidota bacterium]